MPNISPVEQILALDLPHSRQRLVPGLLKVLPGTDHHKYPASCCNILCSRWHTRLFGRLRAHVVDTDGGICQSILETCDLEALRI